MYLTHPKIFLLFGIMLCSNLLISQTLSGNVLNQETLEAIANATVLIYDSEHNLLDETVTDFDGKFELNNVTKDAVLIVEARDCEPVEIRVDGRSWIEVQITPIIVVTDPGTPVPEFPWPPPSPSSRIEIPSSVFSSCKNLQDVNNILTAALSKNGYSDRSYFLVPASNKNGFALATQLEQIDKRRISKKDPNRWINNIIHNKYTGWEYIAATLISKPGYFRVIVFIVTDIPFVPTNKKVDREIAEHWLYQGVIGFPKKVGMVPFNDDHKVIALIYEYEQQKAEGGAILLKPSKYNARAHLRKANIWKALVRK